MIGHHLLSSAGDSAYSDRLKNMAGGSQGCAQRALHCRASLRALREGFCAGVATADEDEASWQATGQLGRWLMAQEPSTSSSIPIYLDSAGIGKGGATSQYLSNMTGISQ